MSGFTLVVDWDGTVTEQDSLRAAVNALGDPGVYGRRFESLGDALAAEIATLRVTEQEAAAWATENVRVRPGLHELVERYDPLVVSSGLPQLIRPVLDRESLTLELRSNDADPHPDGWRVRFRNADPCEVCGDRCKRRSLPAGRVVYVGDGVSDRCAALACERIFARDYLADFLAGQGVPFEPFDTLHDVAAALP